MADLWRSQTSRSADPSSENQSYPASVMHRMQQAAPTLTRASDLTLIGVAGLFAVVDVVIWATDPVVDTGRLTLSIAFLVPCLGALAMVAVAIRRRRLKLALLVVAGAGILLTLNSWTIGTSLPPSFTALFALVLLTIGVSRYAPLRTAVLLTIVAAVAVAAEALRPMVAAAAYLLVVSQAAFTFAVGVGVYLRWSDWRRVAVAEAARSDEHVEIARELHDMVGHYVSGIVVQAQAARHVAEISRLRRLLRWRASSQRALTRCLRCVAWWVACETTRPSPRS